MSKYVKIAIKHRHAPYYCPPPEDPEYGYPLACDTDFDCAAFHASHARRLKAAGLPPDATLEALREAEGTLPYAIPKRDPAQLPATWEGSVLPALREATLAHPELRGCEIGCFTGDADECDRDDPWIRVGSVRVSGYVDRSTFVQMLADAVVLAAKAADVASKPVPEDPRSGVDHAARAMLAALQPEPTMREAAKERREHANIEAEVNGDDPCEAQARTEQTPLPDGWEPWTPKVGDRVVLPDYRTARRGQWFFEGPMLPLCGKEGEVIGVGFGLFKVASRGACWWWSKDGMRPAPEDRPERAPDGYMFGVDQLGAWVRPKVGRMPNGGGIQYYWRRNGSRQNSSRERWNGHEAARQWAAHLLGEKPPELEGAQYSYSESSRRKWS